MADYKKTVEEYLERKGIKYTCPKENVLNILYNGENIQSIPVKVIFEENDDPFVAFRCKSIANFKENEAEGFAVCNRLNRKYRWVKFYINRDSDVVIEADAQIDEVSCGKECLTIVRRIVGIADQTCNEFKQ